MAALKTLARGCDNYVYITCSVTEEQRGFGMLFSLACQYRQTKQQAFGEKFYHESRSSRPTRPPILLDIDAQPQLGMRRLTTVREVSVEHLVD